VHAEGDIQRLPLRLRQVWDLIAERPQKKVKP
jgi:hypothetical protein